jgi:hypothetical protein
VPEYQQPGVLGHLVPGQHRQAAEQAAHEQVKQPKGSLGDDPSRAAHPVQIQYSSPTRSRQCSGDRPAILRKCVHELGRGLLWGLPLAAAAPLLALLGNIALMRLSASSRWRLYPYNWQYVAGLLVPVVGVYGTVLLPALTDEAHQGAGVYCNGLYGWLTVVFVADIVLCVLAAGLGVWYTVRMFRS